jgi:hypothetical protein
MTTQPRPFAEANFASLPIRDLGLQIAGTPLEPILAEFRQELERAGIRRVRPRFYLSTEWGVPADTVAIAIPFYLADARLTALHAQRTGYVEGVDRADILRYLRHEMGHVVNYAYCLYGQKEWVERFGSMTQPYVEDYRPQPFSRRFVEHLPGWYAQKHPDEDWAETFAVWMTPPRAWRESYADWPEALAKLEYCDRTMAALSDHDPQTAVEELDEDVDQLAYSLDEYYSAHEGHTEVLPRGLDAGLRAAFLERPAADGTSPASHRPASELIRSLEGALMANVFRWTGHFPERTQRLLRHLEDRSDELCLVYEESQSRDAAVAVTALVTALAANHVFGGSYLGE